MLDYTKNIKISDLIDMIKSGEIQFNYNAIGFDVLRRYDVIRMVELGKPFDTVSVTNGVIEPMENKHLSDVLNIIESYIGHGFENIRKYMNTHITLVNT